MKIPLHYQHTEFDCGPTSMLNAIDYLFEREQIPPEVIRNIMLYCLDCYGTSGSPGENGTSRTAMMFLSNWLDGFGRTGRLPVSCSYLSQERVYLSQDSTIVDTLRRGGVVVLRLYYDVEHYVLLTGIEDDMILVFDPYYEEKPIEGTEICPILDEPFRYNRKVPMANFNRTDHSPFAMGEVIGREAVLLYNSETKITAEKTIEYFI